MRNLCWLFLHSFCIKGAWVINQKLLLSRAGTKGRKEVVIQKSSRHVIASWSSRGDLERMLADTLFTALPPSLPLLSPFSNNSVAPEQQTNFVRIALNAEFRKKKIRVKRVNCDVDCKLCTALTLFCLSSIMGINCATYSILKNGTYSFLCV